MGNVVEQKAIRAAKSYLEAQGYSVQDVTRKRGHNGYDLIAIKDIERLKIEVKGCTRRWAIPDPYETEFDADKRLVADFLYVIYFIEDERPKLCAIPREAIKPEFVREKRGYRISSRMKKKNILEQFIRTI